MATTERPFLTPYADGTVRDIDGVERAIWTHTPRQTTRLYTLGDFTFYSSTGPIFAVRNT